MPIVPVRRPDTHETPAPAEVPTPPHPDSGSDDYEVGYGRPPKHGQFQPGRSGNPRGRPKRAKGIKTLVREIMTEKVTIRTPSGPRRVFKMEAGLHKLAEKAFGGDVRALQAIVQLYAQSVPDERPEDGKAFQQATLDQHDEAAMAAFQDIVRMSLQREQGDEK